MKNLINKLSSKKQTSKKLLFTVVVLVEIIAILVAATYCWVETVSTIWISGEGMIDTHTYTNATVNVSGSSAIDLTKYFREAGNVHLSSGSSANGKDFYFPVVQKTSASNNATYRKATLNDVNVNYISFSLNVTSSANYDYVFKQVPTIKIGNTVISDSSIRMAVTVDSGTPQVFAMAATSSTVPANTSGTTSTATVYSFADYINNNLGKNKLFSLSQNSTKKITISLWLQDGINTANYSGKQVTIENLSIVPAVPTYAVTAYAVTGTTSQNATGGTVQIGNGTAGAKATDNIAQNGSVTFKAAAKSGYAFIGWYTSATGGTLKSESATYTFTVTSAVTYYARFAKTYNVTAYAYTGSVNTITGGTVQTGTATAGATSVQAVANGKSVTVKATAKSGYLFKGWYSNGQGTGNALSTDTEYEVTVNSAAVKVYAIFVGSKKVTAYAVTDGTSNDSTGGTVKAGSSAAGATSSATIEEGKSVTFVASAKSGYTFEGWYSAATGGTQLAGSSSTSYTVSNITADMTVYARFKKNVNYKIYLNADHYDDASATIWVYAWNDTSNISLQMTRVAGETDDIYEADLGAYYPNVIFVRGPSTMTSLDWNSKWNQTADLTVPSSNSQYTSNMFTPYSGQWDNANGTWSVYQ